MCSGAAEYLPILPGARLPSHGGGSLLSDALDLDVPLVPGYAISGEVDAVGIAVAHVSPGECVVYLFLLLQAFEVSKTRLHLIAALPGVLFFSPPR